MPLKKLGPVHIHYQQSGLPKGPNLVLSNSLGTDFRLWDGLVDHLNDHFHIMRYDKRGHGLSDATASPYRMQQHVNDLANLLDHLKLRRSIVCGLSVGGMIAQALAVNRPDLVRALVLCNTAPRIGDAELWNQRMAAVETDGIASLADAVLQRWFSEQFRNQCSAELAGWRNMLIRTPTAGYHGTCAAIRDTDLRQLTATIAVPTLCIGGSEDGSTPASLVTEMAASITAAQVEIIPGVGHLPCVEAPAVLAGHILSFCQSADLL